MTPNYLSLAINPGVVTASQTGFPVLIHLGAQSGLNHLDSRFVFDILGANSRKISVVTEDGTECPVEVQRWDTVNKEAKLWAKVSKLSPATRLTLYYDATRADNPMVGPTGSPAAEAVWDNNFVGVWHLEGPGPSYLDSTSRRHDGTGHGIITPASFGQVFRGQNTDYIEIPDSSDFSITTTNRFNISVWFSPQSLNMTASEPYVKWMGKGQSGQHEWQFVYYNANSSDPQKIAFYCYNPSGGLGAGDYSRGAIAVGQFIRVLAQAACSSPTVGNEWTWRNEVYNGLPENWQTYGLSYADGSAPIRIGIQWLGQYNGMNGTLAELRISNVQRSLDWEKISDSAEADSLFTVSAPVSPLSVQVSDLNAQLVSGATVILPDGPIRLDTASARYVLPQEGSHLLGGNNTVFEDLGGGAILVSNVNAEVGGFKLSGQCDPGFAVMVIATTKDVVANVHDIYADNPQSANLVVAYVVGSHKLSGSFKRLTTANPDGNGIALSGEGVGPVIDDLTIYRCPGFGAGVAPTRLPQDPEGNSWEQNFDLAEYHGAIYRRINVIKCESNGSWEDGFHTELAPSKQYYVLLDNIASNAGKKPDGIYSCGILAALGPSDSMLLSGNSGTGNRLGDIRVWDEVSQTYAAYSFPQETAADG